MGCADESFVFLVRDHHHALFAPPRDELRTFGTGASKEFAEAGFGGLELQMAFGPRFRLFPCSLATLDFGILNLLTSLTRLLTRKEKARLSSKEQEISDRPGSDERAMG
jgi:hypothetical protein